MARPTKLTENFIAAAQKVVTGLDVIYCTDDELLFLINDQLPEEERICERTFAYWKAKEWDECSEEDADKGRQFLHLLKNALIVEKRNLFQRFYDADQWQKYAWMLERKFDEWNLKRKVGVSDDGAPRAIAKLAGAMMEADEPDESEEA